MTYTRKNQGTCSLSTTVELDENGVIRRAQVDDGCDGHLKGLCALLQGRDAREAIAILRDVRCEDKATSCPHQIALCLEEALSQAGR